MNGFKLISIIALKGCNQKFLKNLEIGTPYNFYKNYSVTLTDNNEDVENVQNNFTYSDFNNFYNLNNNIKINISAIVGENGSGKSTLIELFYYFVYAVSAILKQDENRVLEYYSESLEKCQKILTSEILGLVKEQKLNNAIYLQNKYFIHLSNLDAISKSFSEKTFINSIINELQKEHDKNYHLIQEALLIDSLIKEQFNVAVIYENAEGIHVIKYNKSKITHNNLTTKENNQPFSLTDFFYSICLNFSHHSLNSNTIGGWINSLFHKNDAYVTPIVINPMRENGNFNINKELQLSRERLMSTLTFNIVKNKDYKLLEKYRVTKFLFSVKKGLKIKPRALTSDQFNSLNSSFLLEQYLKTRILSQNSAFLDHAIAYLEEKIPKIIDQYWKLFHDSKGIFNEDTFQNFILNDKSHLTKKIRQTINFIKNTYNRDNVWSDENILTSEMDITTLKAWLQQSDGNYECLNSSQLMEYALPGFFNIDFELQSNDGNIIKLSELSSGEQQAIFNINSILYHLYNIQSVYNTTTDISRTSYKNISIILDEIELYYHPEMQRSIISDILNSLELIKDKDEVGIESINICFLTHSSFILSDIPNNNILKLKRGQNGKSEIIKDENETFSANINDLLADTFFLNNTLIGAFAEKKINELIHKINNNIILNKEDLLLLNTIGDPFLRTSLLLENKINNYDKN